MNIQQVIIGGIRELLFSHDYLVLPAFGGFVLKQSPAHISGGGGLFAPPSKTVSFNSQLKQNDGVLTIWLERKLACPPAEAQQHIQEFTQYCSGLLQVKRRLNLDGIGFFYLDFENNICFEPLPDANFLTESFGLSAVSLQPLETEMPELKREPVFEDRRETIVTATPKTARKRYRQLVSPVLLGLIFVSLLGLLVNNVKMTGVLKASVLEGASKHHYENIHYSPLEILNESNANTAYVADANGIASVRLEENKSVSVRVNAGISSVENSSAVYRTHSSSKFEIVLGCFSIKANAAKMVKKLSKQNVKAFISGQNAKGLFVVSKGAFSTKDQAIEELQHLKDNFPNAWIKKED